MIRKLRFAFSYLTYRIRAKSKFRVHSPFVYKFVSEVLHDNHFYEECDKVSQLHARLKRSRKVIEVTDFGASAGASRFRTRYRRVGEIARQSAIPSKIGELLFRITKYYKPEHILELGTSLGISTMYLALAAPESKIMTIEGCANTAEIATNYFTENQLTNIEIEIGEFGSMLEHVVEKMPKLDLAFIDGNHRYRPTLRYFNACLQKAHNDTILIFDDIHWSAGMERAWEEIVAHPSVTTSIDLFRIGIVFFRKELSKELFVLK